MLLITETLALVRDFLLMLIGLVTGRRRMRLEQALFVRAPREAVWRYIKAREIEYDGFVPMQIKVERDPARPGIEINHISYGARTMDMILRVAEEREGQAILLELMTEGSDPAIVAGESDYLGYVLADAPGGTMMTMSREVTPSSHLAPLTLPMRFRNGARMTQRTYERLAREEHAAGTDGTATTFAAAPGSSGSSWGLTPNGILFSGIALGSFAYLFGLQHALVIAAVIIVHELGHALAMLMVGMQVKGIYLVPFFGGAAIAKGPYRREGQLGFVALMGPGFSLIPSAALLFAADRTGDPLIKVAAEMSAIINLLNLIPIIPLDGGQVLRAALVSMSRTLAHMAGLAGAALGFWLAWIARDWFIGLFVALGLWITLKTRHDTSRVRMGAGSALALLFGYVATIAAYALLLFLAFDRPLPFWR